MVKMLFGFAACLLGACAIPAAATAAPPNIVLILVDDLGFTDTAPYGGEIHTPNISKLAEEGLVGPSRVGTPDANGHILLFSGGGGAADRNSFFKPKPGGIG